jgi:cysteine desulfurase family protein
MNIYLDNAATSAPKPQAVLEEMHRALTSYNANPGRSGHSAALEAARCVFQTRKALSSLLNADDKDCIVHCFNCTDALNLAIKGIMGRVGRALCSDMEHNSVYRPLYRLAREGVADFDVFDTFPSAPARSDGMILSSLASKIRPDTRMVVCAHASNICSAALPIEKIGDFCRRRGLLLVVDGAQSAGAYELDVDRMGIDALCLPGHKGLMGPQGTGMLILGKGVTLDTLMEGGNGMDSLRGEMSEDAPERYEAGTLQTPAIAGLRAGMEFVESVGAETIRAHEARLGGRLRDGLMDMRGVTVYAPRHEGGVVLFSVEGYNSEEVAHILDREGICVRPGFHCSALGHRTLRTPEGGGVRASFGWGSRERDCDALLRAVRKL